MGVGAGARRPGRRIRAGAFGLRRHRLWRALEPRPRGRRPAGRRSSQSGRGRCCCRSRSTSGSTSRSTTRSPARLDGRADSRPRAGLPVPCHHRLMTQQFARVPTDAGAVVREVRGFGGVPWAPPVPLSPPEPAAVRDRPRRPRPLVAHRARLPAGHRRDHDRGRRRRRRGRARPPRRAAPAAVLRPGGRQLPADVPARRGGGAGRRPAARRPVRPPRDAVARFPCQPAGRGARLAPVERRDARADDADPDDDEPAVVGHRPRRLGHHPVHAQPDAAVHRPAPRAGPDRRGDRLRAAAAAGQHAGPGHDRAEHDDRRGGAVGHPRREELRPRGLGARALRRRPAQRGRDRLAAGAVAGVVRGADGTPRASARWPGCCGTRATRSSMASSGSAR